ncbi:two-component regulator propeller domain-containing protein [Aureibaculum sp. 2210JD6-5]|uniref:hybrid sensor histidine kinase/response regulator transcription factor n=1 Tax=Aureibaculum sp. 2210JD6-5 TaxID=3103957 RepID=UPI002AAC822E|nr:two-component regulator propeller domain-containing protein [Aureibaculum sp. 2210JD6-5]MDY7395009.1 two-component regulator propeller domain-containing protein [Aureibaculum sp. 2210JD6-5]
MFIKHFISIIVTSSILFIPSIASSQNHNLKFEEFVIEDGLASVNCILKDSEGFMWFGGTHGLYRYDGYKFKIFKANTNNQFSLSTNNIVSLYEDNEGFIWVGTMYGGINKYNPKTETFLNYKNTTNSIYKRNYITCITGTTDNEIWMGTFGDGMYVFDKDNDSFIKYSYNKNGENSISNDYVFSIAIDNDNVWIATRVGILDKYNKKTSSFLHYIYNNVNYQSTRTGQRICLDALKNPWIGTESDGLYKFDLKTESFRHLKRSDSPNSISTNAITDIKHSQSGEIWITTYNGLNSINTKTNNVTIYQKDNYNPHGITYNLSYSLFIDDNTTIWLGMNDGTVNKTITSPFEIYQTSMSKKLSSLSFNGVTSLYMGTDYLWIGTGAEGLDRFDLRTKTFYNYKNNPNDDKSIPSNIVMNVFEDNDKNVWTGNFKNSIVGYKKEKSDDFLKAKLANPFTQHFNALSIFAMLEDAIHNIWVATYNHGLFKYNKQTFKFEHFTKSNTNNQLSSDTILSIFADSSNNLWIGTLDKGIQIYNQETNTFYSLSDIGITSEPNLNFPIKDIYEDGNGIIWIATEGGGLFYIDKKEKSIKNLNTENGFPSNSFYGIIQDDNEIYWFSTNKGIVSYNLENNRIYTYNTNDGLPTNDFESGANAKSNDGKLFFGSKKGLVAFYPEQLISDSKPINLKLTNLKVFNDVVNVLDKIENYQPLDSSISYKKTLKLPYFLNNFGFEFAVPGNNSPHNIEYQYKLEGIDNRWITTSSELHFANYSNIPYGNYTFKVKAFDENNYDSDTISERQINIMITPAWWQTNTAYLIYILFISGLIYYIYKSVRDRIQLKNELVLEKYKSEKDEELHHSKINFFTTISHELRTSLTLVLSPLQQLSIIKTNNKASNLIMTMNRNGQRLLSLINQILDFRKLESTSTQLNIKEIDLKAFFKELCIPFYQYAKEKNIKFQLSVPNNCETGWIDANKLEIILYNILSNAFKHTKDKIDINIDLDEKDERLIIKIKDNGKGINEEELTKIFDNFYQINDNINYTSGTGIGLAIAKNLIDVHSGVITVKSEPNAYTIFNVIIPILKSFYNEQDINNLDSEIISLNDPSENELTHIDDTKDDTLKIKPILLIIEDHFEIRTLIKDNFSNHFKVFTSTNGLEGKEKAFEIIPDIIISDIMMPKLNGLELCKTLKTDNRTSHIPIILLTARGSHSFKIEGFEYGADDYLIKPFNIEILNVRVENLIKNRQILREKFKKETLIKPKDIAINNIDEIFIEKIINIIEENLANSKFSVKDFASNIGMSHSVLYRKILALTGQTVTEFIKSIRLIRAEELLLKSSYNINEISDMTGFSSLSYFSTCFKKKFGITPSEYKTKFKL